MTERFNPVFLLEPVHSLTGEVTSWELLTRFKEKKATTTQRNPDREEHFFSLLSADEKWQLFLHQVENIIQLSQQGFNQVISVNVDRDIVAGIFADKVIQEKLASVALLRLEISAFFTSRFSSEDLLTLKGVAKITPAPLWLDNFGPGYSSLTMLDSGIFEIVKIDKAFFWQFSEDRTFDILLNHLNQLCRGVIVEGVENQHYVDLLARKPVYGMQGYHWPSVYLDDLFA